MKIAIMQPYFFPYLGYFSLIKHTDMFLLLDTVQYIYQGWIARNRILKQSDGWQYINVPIQSHSYDTLICNIEIQNQTNWKRRILAQMQHYRKTAPYFNDVMSLLDSIFAADHYDIVSLNTVALSKVMEYLGVKHKFCILSEAKLSIKPHNEPDECSLHICEALGDVNEYWNPPGGKAFFNINKFDREGIKLRFHEIVLTHYDQKREGFEPGLSVLDALMFNSIENVNNMLDNFCLS